jgi:pyruvate/2-oxoglutarate dehydrogenase complex dihydrolipoamide dehydrogenase (E3) component
MISATASKRKESDTESRISFFSWTGSATAPRPWAAAPLAGGTPHSRHNRGQPGSPWPSTPSPEMTYDLIVIGSGQGGVPLATLQAAAGRRVLLAERAEPGGTCVNRGCTPSKTLIASAQAAHDARRAHRLGVHAEVRVDFAAVMERVDAVVRQWRESLDRRLAAADPNLTLARAHARFVGPHRVAVGDEVHDAASIVLNVGTRHAVPDIPGLDGVAYLTNGSVFALRELPPRLVVLGGGYIGCELGQAFSRLGSAVTVIEPGPHLVSREDADVAAEVEKALRAEGIEVRTGSRPTRVAGGAGRVAVTLEDGTVVEGTHLLVATGRVPNTGDLGCEVAGVALDARGFVTVDDAFRSSAPGVYAIGDCTPGPQFTHKSWDDGRILHQILAGARSGGNAGRLVPYAMFTDPQLARVGISEREAREQGIAVEVATLPFGHVARAIEADVRAGLMKVLIDPATERFLGAALVGAQAGELVHAFSLLMQAGASARTLVDAELIHPTFGEGLQTLVMQLERYRLGADG